MKPAATEPQAIVRENAALEAEADAMGRASHSRLIADAFAAEMAWLSAAIDQRIRSYFGSQDMAEAARLEPPELANGSPYRAVLERFALSRDERLILALALAPHLAPHVLDVFFLKNEKTDRGFTEFGGAKGVQHSGFLPTGETALFLLAGDDFARRTEVAGLLDRGHPLFDVGLLRLAEAAAGEPAWSGTLSVSASWVRHLMRGDSVRPDFEPGFPAARITSSLSWDDLVLAPATLAAINEIKTWAVHRTELLADWGLGRQQKPGLRALFHGPAGTGKTLAATLLGQALGLDVYRVDLAALVSRYVGETEKQLAELFEAAERSNGILLFEEADALFGRRTEVRDSHDRYANTAIAYLLHRLESHPGIAILANRHAAGIDETVVRRFDYVVPFAPPDAAQRLRLWQNAFGSGERISDDVDWKKIAREHELTGGEIVNAARQACVAAIARGEPRVTKADLLVALRRVGERAARVRRGR